MKNIRIFLSENFPFLVVKFSIYLNRHVFVMSSNIFGTTEICFRIGNSSHQGLIIAPGQEETMDYLVFLFFFCLL